MKTKKFIWRFFALIVIVQVGFQLSPLQFKYSQHSFVINVVLIALFSIFLVFVFKRLWVRIVAPILTFVALSGGLALLILIGALCDDYNVSSYDINNYIVRKGVIGCWAGPSTHSFRQLERKVAGDFITYIVERNEVKLSGKIYSEQPRFNCDIVFEKSNLTFDICEKKLGSEKSDP